jgi:thiol-disulfide isomerase/thioredoxin
MLGCAKSAVQGDYHMHLQKTLPVMLLFGMSACTSEEKTDGDQKAAQTAASGSDSDGDGYSDEEELDAGTDPNDAEDTIYSGGWPYNIDKGSIVDPGWETIAADGATIPNYRAQDQFGDTVDLYDFAGRGRMVVLDVGTKWCGPCKALAEYLSTGDMDSLIWKDEDTNGNGVLDAGEDTDEDGELDLAEYYPWWKSEYSDLRRMVQEGEIYWITILFSDNVSDLATSEDAAEWEEEFPNDSIPVLADTDLVLHDYLDIQSYPAISVLDEDMVFLAYSNGGPYAAFATIFP